MAPKRVDSANSGSLTYYASGIKLNECLANLFLHTTTTSYISISSKLSEAVKKAVRQESRNCVRKCGPSRRASITSQSEIFAVRPITPPQLPPLISCHPNPNRQIAMVPTNLSHRRTHNLLLISKLLSLRDTASPLTLLLDSLEQPATPLFQEYIRRAKVCIFLKLL